MNEPQKDQTLEDVFGPVIYTYTRAQAMEDGVLVDVTTMAKEAGIKFPVAVTQRLHDDLITPTAIEQKHGQDHDGRLWDVLWMFRCAARSISGDRMLYPVIFAREIPGRDDRLKQETVKLKAVIGPGDTPDPVITIMLPDED